MEAFLAEFNHLKIRLEDIKSATDNFDGKKVIGTGGFGKVFEGEVSHFKGRSMVAFKRLDRRFGQGDSEFWKEIMMLSRYTHDNLILLLGYCDENGEKILIYEHASNGSLDRHLRSTTLSWTQRLKICLDAARGLSYLHDDKGTQQRILHRDIKSSNVLLDNNWNAKVSDMGLSKLGPANQQHTALITNVVGTLGYLDPVYMELGILTKESDVYSFGVVLFEVLCGRLCFENRNGKVMSLVRMWKQKYEHQKLPEIIFQDLIQEIDPRCLEIYSDVAFRCLHEFREHRPTMSRVVETLETALESQEFYDEMKHPFNYEEIMKAAVDPLTYNSEEELNSILAKGILLNGGKTWFSLNQNGEHCEMISAAGCHIQTAKTSSGDKYVSAVLSRFPRGSCFYTHRWEFKVHVRAQFLSPQLTYSVNLVFKRIGEVTTPSDSRCLRISYRLKGEEKLSTSYLADVREDGWLMAELYQFESQKRYIDLEIFFEGRTPDDFHYMIEGIAFLPIEKVEHEVEEDDMQTISGIDDTYWGKKLPNDYDEIIKWSKDDVKWKTNKELYSILRKGFLMKNDEVWFSLAKNGKRCLMLPAKAAFIQRNWEWTYSSESRFGVVAFEPIPEAFSIICKINFQLLSPETAYSCYLVYKIPEDTYEELFNFDLPFKVKDGNFNDESGGEVLNSNLRFMYLLNPRIPVIRSKNDQKSHNPVNRPKLIRRSKDDQKSYNPMNRPKLKGNARRRDDGWMEVQVCEFQPCTSSNMESQSMRVDCEPVCQMALRKLTVQGIEFRPQ